jgi:hypothetical protein
MFNCRDSASLRHLVYCGPSRGPDHSFYCHEATPACTLPMDIGPRPSSAGLRGVEAHCHPGAGQADGRRFNIDEKCIGSDGPGLNPERPPIDLGMCSAMISYLRGRLALRCGRRRPAGSRGSRQDCRPHIAPFASSEPGSRAFLTMPGSARQPRRTLEQRSSASAVRVAMTRCAHFARPLITSGSCRSSNRSPRADAPYSHTGESRHIQQPPAEEELPQCLSYPDRSDC